MPRNTARVGAAERRHVTATRPTRRRNVGLATTPAPLRELARARLEWLVLRRAPATVQFYGFAYRRLDEFVAAAAEADAARWTPELADAYATWLLARGVRPATARHYLDALLALLRWAVKHGKLPGDPLAGYEPPEGRPGEVPGYTVEDIRRMLAVCADDPLGRRDRAILTFGYDTGVRTSELAAMRIGDVDLPQGTAKVRRGKGGKARVATFGPTASAVVLRYLERDHGDPGNPLAPLFEGRGGRPLGRSGVYGLVRRRAQAAGVQGRKGLHRLRHSCAVQHLMHGGNARTIQEQLGHADMEMTRRYTALEVEDRRRQWRQTSPVERTLRTEAGEASQDRTGEGPEATCQ
jgi:site-specific recombinase XerD